MKLRHTIKTFLLLLIVNLSISVSCSKSDDFIVNGVDFYWDQTGCSDPWRTKEGNSESAVRPALTEYLKENGVSKVEIRFENTLPEGALICLACHCPTGIRILLKVAAKDADKMEELGFTQL